MENVEEKVILEEVKKGGKSWLQFGIKRSSMGLEIFAKVDPDVEQFIKEMSGGAVEPLETYGRNWYHADKTKSIKVYRLDKNFDSPTYQLSNLCGSLLHKQTLVNLSWLQFQGLSAPEGIDFIVSGPFSRNFVEVQLPRLILTGTRDFFKDFVVPIHVHLNISSMNE